MKPWTILLALALVAAPPPSTLGSEEKDEPAPTSSRKFAEDTTKASQWRGFLRKSRLEGAPSELVAVIDAIAVFLGPVAGALHAGRGFEACWRSPGPWSNA